MTKATPPPLLDSAHKADARAVLPGSDAPAARLDPPGSHLEAQGGRRMRGRSVSILQSFSSQY